MFTVPRILHLNIASRIRTLSSFLFFLVMAVHGLLAYLREYQRLPFEQLQFGASGKYPTKIVADAGSYISSAKVLPGIDGSVSQGLVVLYAELTVVQVPPPLTSGTVISWMKDAQTRPIFSNLASCEV